MEKIKGVINIKEESEMANKSCILNLLNIRKKINKNMKIAKNSKMIKLFIPKNFRPNAWKINEPKGTTIEPFSLNTGEKVLLKFRSTIDLT